jgi:chromate transporter
VVEAVLRIGRRALRSRMMVAIAATAFVAIFVFGVPFPLIIAVAALAGWSGHRAAPARFQQPPIPAAVEGVASALFDDHHSVADRPSGRRTVGTVALWLLIWWLPVLALALTLGPQSSFVVEGLFFSKVAVVTFGGAYAVLAYIAQQAVEVYGWLAPGEMLDGLGMAETTPGPLIQVVQFVGFMGAYRAPAPFEPLMAGVVGSVVTTWVTFAPCFLWIFAGAPYIEWLRGRQALTAALSGITAAVVGVILNLALWFSVHTLFRETREVGAPFDMTLPVLDSANFAAIGIGAAAFLALFGLRWGMLPTLAVGASLGLATALFGGG